VAVIKGDECWLCKCGVYGFENERKNCLCRACTFDALTREMVGVGHFVLGMGALPVIDRMTAQKSYMPAVIEGDM
jgi:hypothetical protein